MKSIILAAITMAVVITANAQTKAEEKKIKEVTAKAAALPIERCELNGEKKGWLKPNRDPIGNLPVYRCVAEGMIGAATATATFTQIPDGSETTEAVELCTFSDFLVKCEVVPAERPARRTADLAKYSVKERQFEPIRCENTSVGTVAMSMCSKPQEKRQGPPNKVLGKK
jgi:hypothetical protein